MDPAALGLGFAAGWGAGWALLYLLWRRGGAA